MKLSSVNTVTEEFENAAFFLRLGLPSSLICYENALQIGGFACEPMCTAKNIKKKPCRHNHALADLVILKHKSKMIGDCCASKFLQHSVGGKYLLHFQSETFVLKV